MSRTKWHSFLPFVALLLTGGCISTPHAALAPDGMTDAQLLAELDSVQAQLGIATSSLSYLHSAMPPPDPVITAHSFSTFYGTASSLGDSVIVSGTATTTTRYETYDQNATARALNQIAQSIQQSRIVSLQRRGSAIEAELRHRIHDREEKLLAQQAALQRFFDAKPYLLDERSLLSTLLPWVRGASDADTLERLGAEADTVLAGRRGGSLTGRWYGLVKLDTQWHPEYAVQADIALSSEALDIQVRTVGGRTVHFTGRLEAGGVFVGKVWAPNEETKYPDPLTALLEMSAHGKVNLAACTLQARGGLAGTAAELSLSR